MPRFYCAAALVSDTALELPAGAARHVQVLRLQPGDSITLFDGQSTDEFDATITRMGRSDVAACCRWRRWRCRSRAASDCAVATAAPGRPVACT